MHLIVFLHVETLDCFRRYIIPQYVVTHTKSSAIEQLSENILLSASIINNMYILMQYHVHWLNDWLM